MPPGSANSCHVRNETNLCRVVWIQSNLMVHLPDAGSDDAFGFVGPFRHVPLRPSGIGLDRRASTFACSMDFGTCELHGSITRQQYRACVALLTSSRPWHTSGCPG